jgi:hypothetical protein
LTSLLGGWLDALRGSWVGGWGLGQLLGGLCFLWVLVLGFFWCFGRFGGGFAWFDLCFDDRF